MPDQRDPPRPREVDQLQELMERVGEDEERREKLLRVAATDPDTYEDLLEFYQRKAAQVVTKDVFYPYEDLDGSIVIGTDPDGREIGVTREQLNEHLLLVGRTGSGKTQSALSASGFGRRPATEPHLRGYPRCVDGDGSHPVASAHSSRPSEVGDDTHIMTKG